MLVVAFGHRRNVGKDTLANFVHTIIKTEHNGRFKVARVSFASKLKSVCHDLFGWAGMESEQFYENNRAAKEVVLEILGMSPRDLYILVGTTHMRSIHPDVWAENAFTKEEDADLVLVSDGRFPNEAKKVRDLGGLLVKVDRPGTPQFDDPADSALADWTDWDRLIKNDVEGEDGLKNLYGEAEILASYVVRILETVA